MKYQRILSITLLSAMVGAGVTTAQAAVTYDASAVGDFSINSILSSGSTQDGLLITAGIQNSANATHSSAAASANVESILPSPGFVLESASYDPTAVPRFFVSPDAYGSAEGGTADSSREGMVSIIFINTSSHRFEVNLGMHYLIGTSLDPSASDDSKAHASLGVELSDFSNFGIPDYQVPEFSWSADLSSDPLHPEQSMEGDQAFIVSIDPYQSKLFSIDFDVEGQLRAVPLPAAFWLLGGSLVGLFGFFGPGQLAARGLPESV